MKRGIRALSIAFLAVLFPAIGQAQEQWDYLGGIGKPSFSTIVPVPFGYVNISNGNLHLELPMANPRQRGAMPFNARFVYDSRIWTPYFTSGEWVWAPILGQEWNYAGAHGSWSVMTDYDDLTGELTWPQQTTQGRPDTWASWTTVSCSGSSYRVFNNFQFTLGMTTFYFDFKISQNSCTGYPTSNNGYATDGSGYHLYVQADPSTGMWDSEVMAPDGTDVWHGRDSNGNYFSSSQNSEFPLLDTLGRAVVSVSGTPQVGSFPVYYDVDNSSGSTSRYTANYTTVTLGPPGFNQSGVSDIRWTDVTQVSSIVLPDQTSYSFQYDPTYGELTTMSLPTGGSMTFGYTIFTDAYGNTNRWITSVSSPYGTWTFNPQQSVNCQPGQAAGCTELVTVTQPSQDYAKYQLYFNGAPWLNWGQYYSASGALLYTATLNYDWSNYCSVCFGNVGYVHKTAENDTVPGVAGANIFAQTSMDYDSPQTGNIRHLKEWNFYSSAPSATADRETDITYQPITIPFFGTSGGPTFVSGSNIQKPTSSIVCKPTNTTDCSNATPLSYAEYEYDSYTPVYAGASNQDYTDYGTSDTSRGNLSVLTRIGSGQNASYTYKYDTTGQIVSIMDPFNNLTQYSYSDNFASGSNLCTLGNTNAYVTTITPPLSGSQYASYDCGTGQTKMLQDQNGAQTLFNYNDPFSRLTQTSNPIHGWTLNAYTSPTQIDTYAGVYDSTPSSSCTSCKHDQVSMDYLSRPYQQTFVNDPDGTSYSSVQYDSTGRIKAVFNPYRSTGDSIYGSTNYAFDGLNRPYVITEADGSDIYIDIGASVSGVSQSCSTLGYPKRVTDEAGKQRLSWIDAFGRIVELDEPNSSGSLTVATCYQYDALNNLLSVTQTGGADSTQWRTRSYSYDGLSRITSAAIPETNGNPTHYYYTTATGTICAGDPMKVCRRTDPRNITTTYSYDAENRLTGKTYTGSTPAVSYFYDQSSYNGLSITNGLGRRTGMSDGTGQTAWSYDAAGNVVAKRQTINGVTNTITYTHTPFGAVASLTTPGGRTYSYTYGNAMRPVSLIDQPNNITYVQNAHYDAAGHLTSAQHGLNLAVTETNGFNNRLQLLSTTAATSSGSFFSMNYNWTKPDSPYQGTNNGMVYQVQNNLDNTRSVQFTYDLLNRLQSAGTYNATTWGDNYYVDPWGNLLQENVTQGTAEGLQVTVDTHNHINGFTYDAAGNLTDDGYNAMNFDAENQETPTASSTYYYDGEGHRVEKLTNGSPRYYWYDDDFNIITSTGSVGQDYIYFDGRRVAFLGLSSQNQHYYWQDYLGSTGVMTNSSGSTIQWEADYYPFGTQRMITNNLDNYYDFTGDEWDSGTGYYYSGFREQSPKIGRFMSPDPISGDVTDPQSWNAYSYVGNRPTAYTDTLGLGPEGVVLGSIPWLGPISVVADVLDVLDIFGVFGGGGGQPPFHPNGPMPGQSGGGQSGGVWSEQLPNGVTLTPPSLWSLILPVDNQCDFGACVPLGSGFAGDAGTVKVCDDNGNCEVIDRPEFSITVSASACNGPCLRSDANAVFAQMNRNGIQSLTNPCTIGAFYSISAGIGGGSLAAGSTVVWVADNPATIGWWARYLPYALAQNPKPGAVQASAASLKAAGRRASGVVNHACSSIQGR